MIQIQQIKVRPGADLHRELRRRAARMLGLKEGEIRELQLLRRSLDARKKPELFYSCGVEVSLKGGEPRERQLVQKLRNPRITAEKRVSYVFPEPGCEPCPGRPVIAGMGPAGLFCGYYLARAGYRPILIERGKPVEARTEDVERFWREGVLAPDSNGQFGEGGAGAVSDGKLNTLVKDKLGRNREILQTLVRFGAPERILWDARPHIGTDILCRVVRAMRREIQRLGGEVFFETRLEDVICREGRLESIRLGSSRQGSSPPGELPCRILVLAVGHSARDTFQMLLDRQLPMEAKSFAVGLRVEHPQESINQSQYGRRDPGELGAAAYKLTASAKDGRGVYSFCMCPGGYVVNASSEKGRLAVNGMSYSAREGRNANSAVIVTVTPEDFAPGGKRGDGPVPPLAGVAFQRELEERAFRLGGGKIPVQRYGLFRACVEKGCGEAELSPRERADALAEGSVQAEGQAMAEGKTLAEGQALADPFDSLTPCTKGEWVYGDVSRILPGALNRAFVEGMEQFGTQIPGFDRPQVLLLGVESRTSSPVRMPRDEDGESSVKGIYPCGEGAGYAGGITSAAMDGLRTAEKIAGRYAPPGSGDFDRDAEPEDFDRKKLTGGGK